MSEQQPVPIYFIGGVATDHRLFSHQLTHIPGAIYLPFPVPDEGDTMADYVLKFLPLIDATKPFKLVAHSMGGIMAVELLKHIKPERVVLLSTVKCRDEMPWRLRQLKHSRLHKLLSGRGFVAGVKFGSLFLPEINKVPQLRKLVIEMTLNNTPAFLTWCVNAIVNWEGKKDYSSDIVHIHGTRDAMFPIKNIRNAIKVEGGTHNMLLSNPEDVTQMLLKYL